MLHTKKKTPVHQISLLLINVPIINYPSCCSVLCLLQFVFSEYTNCVPFSGCGPEVFADVISCWHWYNYIPDKVRNCFSIALGYSCLNLTIRKKYFFQDSLLVVVKGSIPSKYGSGLLTAKALFLFWLHLHSVLNYQS